jgi:hypothetical protein
MGRKGGGRVGEHEFAWNIAILEPLKPVLYGALGMLHLSIFPHLLALDIVYICKFSNCVMRISNVFNPEFTGLMVSMYLGVACGFIYHLWSNCH